MWNHSVAYLYVSWHLLNCHHLSVSHLPITIRSALSISLALLFLSKCHWFLFFSFLSIDCRFTAMWPLPSVNQVFLLLLHRLYSSSNNNHTHLILTRLSMIDGLTGGLHVHTYIYTSITLLVSSLSFTQLSPLEFLSN